MLCLGPVCVPVWQLGVIFALVVGPLKAVVAYVYDLCSRRRRRGSDNEDAVSSNMLLLHRGAAVCPVYEEIKRRLTEKEVHVLHIRSDEEMRSFWQKLRDTKTKQVFADFSAQWCGPCHSISPFYELLSAGYDGVFISIDVDVCPDTAEAAGITVLPTLVVLKDTGTGAANPWEVVASISGANARKWEEFVAGHTVPRNSYSSSSSSSRS